MRHLVLLLATGGACGRVHFVPLDDAVRTGDTVPANAIGCADGEREAFLDETQFPTIAGCAGSWMGGHNLREGRTGQPCGDDLAGCVSVAELCAVGWHICGNTGEVSDLTDRVSAVDCTTGGGGSGSFVAAMGHCTSCASNCSSDTHCSYASSYDCPSEFSFCAEPICCGPDCVGYTCNSGAYPDGMTRMGAVMTACGSMPPVHTGVLCCSD